MTDLQVVVHLRALAQIAEAEAAGLSAKSEDLRAEAKALEQRSYDLMCRAHTFNAAVTRLKVEA